jgi:hypothetical protein
VGLASISCGERQAELLQIAERDAWFMERENMPWSNPQALLIRAAVSCLRGQIAKTLAVLEKAEADFRAADMALYATVALRRRGQLQGGDAGKELIAAADTWMIGQKILNPVRFTATYSPGFGD